MKIFNLFIIFRSHLVTKIPIWLGGTYLIDAIYFYVIIFQKVRIDQEVKEFIHKNFNKIFLYCSFCCRYEWKCLFRSFSISTRLNYWVEPGDSINQEDIIRPVLSYRIRNCRSVKCRAQSCLRLWGPLLLQTTKRQQYVISPSGHIRLFLQIAGIRLLHIDLHQKNDPNIETVYYLWLDFHPHVINLSFGNYQNV